MKRDIEKLNQWRRRSQDRARARMDELRERQEGEGVSRRDQKRIRRADKLEKAFRRAFHSKEFLRWLHLLPCVACQCRAEIEAAHVKSRGAGGTWRDVVPLCKRHHRMLHDMGIQTFQAVFCLDLPALARSINLAWRLRGGSDS